MSLMIIGGLNTHLLRNITAVSFGTQPAVLLNAQGNSMISNPSALPQVISPIADRVELVGASAVTIDLATKFSGATSYAISPANTTGVTLAGAILTIDPIAVVAQHTITVTGINSAGTSAPLAFALTINAATPTVAEPLPDQRLVVGGSSVTIDLSLRFADAVTYAISPAGQGVTVGGNVMTISAAAARNATYTVTATNITGQSVTDAFDLVVAAATAAPSITAQPTISGGPVAGSVLNAAAGTATGNPTPMVAHQWLSNDAAIPGATEATFDTAGRTGQAISLRVTWSNGIGSPAVATTAAITITAVEKHEVDPGVANFALMETYTIDKQQTYNWSAFNFYIPDDVGPFSRGDATKLVYNSNGSITFNAARGPAAPNGRSWYTGALQGINGIRHAIGRAGVDVHVTQPNAVAAFFSYASNSKEIDFELVKKGGVPVWAPNVHMPKTGGGSVVASKRILNTMPLANRIQRLEYDLRPDRCDFYCDGVLFETVTPADMGNGYIWDTTTNMAMFLSVEFHNSWAGWTAADYDLGAQMVVYAVTPGATSVAPVVMTQPSISGTTEPTGVLTLAVGTASGNPAPTATRQWIKDGANLAGEIGLTVDKAVHGAGNYSAVVTWSNGIGSPAVATTAAIRIIAAAVAPAFGTGGTIAIDGNDIVLTPPIVTAGAPTPTVTLAATRNGSPITVTGGKFVGGATPGNADQVYAATWTAANGTLPDAVQKASLTVAALVVEPLDGGLLDLTKPVFSTTSTTWLQTSTAPLVLNTGSKTSSRRGGWSFQSIAGARYLAQVKLAAPLPNFTEGAALRASKTAAFDYRGPNLIAEAPIATAPDAEGVRSVAFTGTGNPIWVGISLGFPATEANKPLLITMLRVDRTDIPDPIPEPAPVTKPAEKPMNYSMTADGFVAVPV